MARDRGPVRERSLRLPPSDPRLAAERRRVDRALLGLDAKREKGRRAVAARLGALRSKHRRDLAALLGPSGLRRYRDLRARLSKAPRARRLRESRALLAELGVDPARVSRTHGAFADAVRRLLAWGGLDGHLPPVLPGDSPWFTYTPPYGGSHWSFTLDLRGGATAPLFAPHLDRITGRIGSSIRTRVVDPGEDALLDVETYSALSVWHTAYATGPIEGYLALEHRASSYSGRVTDEFGASDVTYFQGAQAVLRVVDPGGPQDAQDSPIFAHHGYASGDAESWSAQVARPRDVHWYYVRTAASFAQGRPLLLEAAVRNRTWFDINDQSVSSEDDLDLRLERIVVRSIPSRPDVFG